MSLSNRVAVMNGGRIEQMGPPEVIYERPANRFVHGFVGETICLLGRLKGDAARVQVGASEIGVALESVATLASGARVEIALRPEDVSLKQARAEGDTGVFGRVAGTTYYGDRVECAIHIEGTDDQTVVVNFGKERRLAPGDRVFLGFDSSRIKLWPQSAS